jgi:hypothetical protein
MKLLSEVFKSEKNQLQKNKTKNNKKQKKTTKKPCQLVSYLDVVGGL